MIITKDDERNFKNADKCFICYKKYTNEESVLETPVTLLESTEDQPIKNVI